MIAELTSILADLPCPELAWFVSNHHLKSVYNGGVRLPAPGPKNSRDESRPRCHLDEARELN